MGLTASYHSGKGKAKHNDLSFNLLYAYKDKGNIYVVNKHVSGLQNKGFEVCEKKLYEILFKNHVVHQNARNDKARHSERNKTLDEYYNANQPNETIFQIGDMTDNVLRNDLLKAYSIYREKQDNWNVQHGNHVITADYAVHCHEDGGNHIHERNIYVAVDKDGNYEVNMTKALEQAGLQRPNPNEKTSRYNNVKMTFDTMCRNMWLDSCKEAGLEMFDDYDHTGNKKHFNVRNYKILQEKALKARERALEAQYQAKMDKLSSDNEKALKTQITRLYEVIDEVSDILYELKDIKDVNLQARTQDLKRRYENVVQERYSEDEKEF